MIRRLSVSELRELTAADIPRISDYDRDEMAIPSYLHKNVLIRWLMWKRYEYIAGLARFTKDMSALEFGCGTGVFLPELDRSCGTVYAIDIFPEFAKTLCEQLELKVRFVDDVAEVPAGALDVIVAADVLEHIEDDDLTTYLALFLDKLKDDGRLLMSGPTESVVYRIGRAVAGFGDKGDYHVTNINKLIRRIQDRGFHLQTLKTLPFKIPPFLFKVCEFTRG